MAEAGRKSALQTSASEPKSSCVRGKHLAGRFAYLWAHTGLWGTSHLDLGKKTAKPSGRNENFSTRRGQVGGRTGNKNRLHQPGRQREADR